MTNVSNAKAQDRTLAYADAWGEPWTTDEVDLVIAFTDDVRDEELATTLGRTLYAVWAIQTRIRNEGATGVRDDIARACAARRRVEAARVEVGFDFVTTFPPGWND